MNKITLDQKLKNRIKKAANSKKLDPALGRDFMTILKEGKNQLLAKAFKNITLESTVSYFAFGKPQVIPEGMARSYSNSEFYSARTTYRELLNHVENSEFSYFEKAQRLHRMH